MIRRMHVVAPVGGSIKGKVFGGLKGRTVSGAYLWIDWCLVLPAMGHEAAAKEDLKRSKRMDCWLDPIRRLANRRRRRLPDNPL